MSQFILFIDDAGAEFTKARATRKEVVALYDWKPIKLVPIAIRPLEVIQEGGAAQRAAGGFLLLGPVGAAAGVLLGEGPKVLFELIMVDGSARRGVVDQRAFPALRKQVEAIQHYRPGQTGKSLGEVLAALIVLAICIALGPVGAVLLIGSIIAFFTVRARKRRKQELAS